MEWLQSNAPVVSAVTSILMVFIWFAYLQLFLMEFMRQRRSSIIIARGAGTGIQAHCLVGNMGAQPIFIVAIIARMRTPSDDVHVDLTDPKPSDEVDEADIARRTRQRPLTPGSYMDGGTFETALDALNRRRGFTDGHNTQPATEDGRTNLEMLVFAVHSADDNIIAARRDFSVEKRDGDWQLVPQRLSAEQIRSRRERRRLRREWEKVLIS
ncbi:MAG: hypothetical protein ACFBWO_12070 [Paracoccaceae bacterium]